jgi:hypothetical protein
MDNVKKVAGERVEKQGSIACYLPLLRSELFAKQPGCEIK